MATPRHAGGRCVRRSLPLIGAALLVMPLLPSRAAVAQQSGSSSPQFKVLVLVRRDTVAGIAPYQVMADAFRRLPDVEVVTRTQPLAGYSSNQYIVRLQLGCDSTGCIGALALSSPDKRLESSRAVNRVFDLVGWGKRVILPEDDDADIAPSLAARDTLEMAEDTVLTGLQEFERLKGLWALRWASAGLANDLKTLVAEIDQGCFEKSRMSARYHDLWRTDKERAKALSEDFRKRSWIC